MERYFKKFDVMVNFAQQIAKLSTCTRLQVGCVVVNHALTHVLAMGYNGPARGRPNNSCTGAAGSCGCIHAEANALIKLKETKHMCIITTHSPCEHCEGLILNSNIERVYYFIEYRKSNVNQFIRIGDHYEDLERWYARSRAK